MAKYHTEGMVKSIKLIGSRPEITIDPAPPFRFVEKNAVKELTSIIFRETTPKAEPTKAFLQGDDSLFSMASKLAPQVDFAAFLSLKEQRTRIRIEVEFNASKPVLPTQIESISICD